MLWSGRFQRRVGTEPGAATVRCPPKPDISNLPNLTTAPPCGGRLVDFGPSQQVVEAADAVPAVAVGFDHQPVLALVVAMAVVLGEQVHQLLAVLGVLVVETDRKRDLARL